tara:strand:- start:977 stop:1135 length:159 start_codon:yes stop_codon:yes gene_type:complete
MSWISKVRPQILVAILGLTVIAIIGLNNGAIEVTTGCIGGVTGLGFKLLEAE